ncbi:DUF982 domain-containing protein [Mesorhizobium sp. VK24D]|uniref:DUF982 domain-containing protein n=1 Tax=Mesorhizobium album TaxID=3072314 RepID=A0ABU4Y8F0_9HYPH|nr:DUF982 domain-containing protein [Mesorhizobium sp. VK24D]MDX8483205.1 DUF982 domain-containing protein [Mesorhizobium sp. VK24D]
MNEATDMPLRAPVAIAVGAGFKREIASLAAMQNFLKEWPAALRGDCYCAALRACDLARTGEMELDEARRAFLSFAEKAGILWTGVDPVTALREAKIRRGRIRRANQPRQRANQPRQ